MFRTQFLSKLWLNPDLTKLTGGRECMECRLFKTEDRHLAGAEWSGSSAFQATGNHFSSVL